MNATGLDVRIEDVSAEVGALALQGQPRPARARGGDRRGLVATSSTSAAGRPPSPASTVDVTRTGYTGDLGYELWVDVRPRRSTCGTRCSTAGEPFGLRPVGMGALDVLRVEAGPHPPGRRVHERPQRVQRGAGVLAVRAGHGPAGRPVQAEVRRQAGAGRGGRGRRPLAPAGRPGPRPAATSRRRSAGTASRPCCGSEPRRGRSPSTGREQVGKMTSSTWSPILKQVIGLAVLDKASPSSGRPFGWTGWWRGPRDGGREGRPAPVPRPPPASRLVPTPARAVPWGTAARPAA